MAPSHRGSSPALWLLLVGLAIALAVSLHVWMLDGLDGWMIANTLGRAETRFAPGYSDSAFRNIERGVNKGRVFDLLGEPLDKETYGPCQTMPTASDCAEIWYYSTSSGESGDYSIRAVELGGDGVVRRRLSSLTLD